MAGRPELAWASLGFGLAALLASWNPLSAPFGLGVGAAAAVLALRALSVGGRRPVAVAGLVGALAAVAVSATVLALTAGVGRTQRGAALVEQPGAAATDAVLRQAGEASRPSREAAGKELDTLQPPPKSKPAN